MKITDIGDTLHAVSTDAIRTADEEANEATQNDQPQGYISSSAPSSLRGEEERFLSSSSMQLQGNTPSNTASNTARNTRNRATLNPLNILPEGFSRTRKPSRKAAYYSALNGVSTGSKAAFSASLLVVAPKDIRLHRDNLPPKPKYYKDMIKHPLAAEFIQATSTEIETLQSKGTWKRFKTGLSA